MLYYTIYIPPQRQEEAILHEVKKVASVCKKILDIPKKLLPLHKRNKYEKE